MNEIFIEISHSLIYPNPLLYKTFSKMIFSDLIEDIYDEHPIFYENNMDFKLNGKIIPFDCNKTLKELGIKDNTKLKAVNSKNQKKKLRKKEKKLNQIKEEMLERQNNERKKEYKEYKEKQNNEINQVLEDMCIYGNVMKEIINNETKNNPDKYIKTEDVLNMGESDKELFALGLVSFVLNNNGINTVIEKETSNNDENIKEDATLLQFLSNGMMSKTKYELHFDFGKEKNYQLLNDKEKYENFQKDLKLKISKEYNLPEDEIIITFPQKGSLKVQLIFQSDEFNELEINEFINKFKNDPDFQELCNLKEIHTDVIISHCRLTKRQLDPEGNRYDGWPKNESRGGKPYDSPVNWKGIGLKVKDIYLDNIWIGMKNIEGEWCVAYHGVARGQKSIDVKKVVGLIYKGTFKPGQGQYHKNCEDSCHPGKKVGIGVYVTPHIKTAEEYAGISIINGVSYKTVLMVRINPNAIRGCLCRKDFWVVNGTPDEIRPYRILYKKCEKC